MKMKTLEQLAALKTTDIAALIPSIIADVEAVARSNRVARSLLKENTDLVGGPGTVLTIPKRGEVTAEVAAEGSTPSTESNPSYSGPVTITPFKIRTYSKITQEALDASRFDLIHDEILEAGEALAELEDQQCIGEFFGYLAATGGAYTEQSDVIAGGASATIYALTNGVPLVKVVSITDSVTGPVALTEISKEDYSLGKVKLVGADHTGHNLTFKTYKMARTNWFSSATVAVFAFADIVTAYNAMVAKKQRPTHMMIHPAIMGTIMTDDRFIDVSKSGKDTLETGQIGTVFGMKVLVAQNMPYLVAFANADKLGKFVIKRQLDSKRWDNPSSDSTELYFYFEFAPKVVWEDAVFICLDCAADAAVL